MQINDFVCKKIELTLAQSKNFIKDGMTYSSSLYGFFGRHLLFSNNLNYKGYFQINITYR